MQGFALRRGLGWSLIGVGALVGLCALLFALRGALIPVAAAMFIAYLLDPVVDRIETWRCNRALAIVVLLAGFFLGAAVFSLVTVPVIVADLRAFFVDVPGKLAGLSGTVGWALGQMGFDHVPTSVSDLIAQVESTGADARQLAEWAAQPASELVPALIGGTASLVQMLVTVLLIPVLTFYLLYDFDRIVAGTGELVPARFRGRVVGVTKEVDQVLGQFVRGQITVMIILAVLYAVGYWLVGVKMALLIGLLAGLVSFIPYVGSALALVLALLVVALGSQDPMQAIWVVVIYGAIQLLEGFLITPKIVGDKVGLSAIWVLLALMFGGELFGFLGVLLALPVAAVLKVFVAHGLTAYRASGWYRSGAPT